jgi:predicted nucleotide-binding protein (sugar kinase/HSP70/actin superfamily)
MSISPNMLNLLETTGIQANAMVSQLNEIFPPVNPSPDDTMEKIMYRSGQRSVVEWIIQYMEAE